jgi:hypothetical protein
MRKRQAETTRNEDENKYSRRPRLTRDCRPHFFQKHGSSGFAWLMLRLGNLHRRILAHIFEVRKKHLCSRISGNQRNVFDRSGKSILFQPKKPGVDQKPGPRKAKEAPMIPSSRCAHGSLQLYRRYSYT